MHQTLLYLPNQIGSIPLFGLGLLLVVWLVFSAGLLTWLVRRQGWSGDTASYVPLLAIVAAAIWLLLPALCDFKGLPIRGYGVMLLVAVTAAVALAAWRARRLGLDPDLVFALAVWTFIPGIIGARLFYVIEYWDTFPSAGAMVNVARGGLVVYGSLVGGALGLLVYVRKNRLSLLATWDLITPSMMLGLALGRIGCLMNGCCFGGPCDLPWAVTFPGGSPPYTSEVERGQMVGFRISGNRNAEPLVLEVTPDSPAERAGLRQGDRLESINDYPITSAGSAHQALAWAFHKSLPLILSEAERNLILQRVPLPPDLRDRLVPETPNRSTVALARESWNTVAEAVARGAELAEDEALRQRLEQVGGKIQRLVEAQQPPTTSRLSIRTADGRDVRIEAVAVPPRSLHVHPTQIYAAINALLLCLFLLAYDPYCRRDGQLFAMLITIYPVARFLLEIIRIDESPIGFTGLSISQNVSLGLLLLATALWVTILRRPPGRAFHKAA